MEEKFVDVLGYEGSYKIGDRGTLWLERRQRASFGEIYKDRPTVAALYGKRKERRMLHVLVARHFLPNPGYHRFVVPINGDYSDIRVENLRWVPNGLMAKMDPPKRAPRENPKRISEKTLSHDEVLHMREMFDQQGYSISEIAEMFRVTTVAVWKIVNRQIWKNI